LPQSSSASRFTAGASTFFILSQSGERPAKASFGQHTSKRGLAHFQRITPHVVAIQLDQVEGVGDSFAIDDAGVRAQAGQCLDDQREAAGEVIARPAVERARLRIFVVRW